MADEGVQVVGGTIVDATIIDDTSSTKNQCGEHDPEMYQATKGDQWYLGMKGQLHVGSCPKSIHAIVGITNTLPVSAYFRLRNGQ